MSQSYINVIGAGLAGSEAAYQIAERGIPVKLYEMRGVKSTHNTKLTILQNWFVRIPCVGMLLQMLLDSSRKKCVV